MDKWLIWTSEGEYGFTGSQDEVVKHLEEKYPDFHTESYTDQVIVWSSADVVDNINVDPIATATPI